MVPCWVLKIWKFLCCPFWQHRRQKFWGRPGSRRAPETCETLAWEKIRPDTHIKTIDTPQTWTNQIYIISSQDLYQASFPRFQRCDSIFTFDSYRACLMSSSQSTNSNIDIGGAAVADEAEGLKSTCHMLIEKLAIDSWQTWKALFRFLGWIALTNGEKLNCCVASQWQSVGK